MTSSLPLFDPDSLPDDAEMAAAMLTHARPVEPGHYDELRSDEGSLRETWARFATQAGAALGDLGRRQTILSQQILEDGVTYNIYADPEGGLFDTRRGSCRRTDSRRTSLPPLVSGPLRTYFARQSAPSPPP